jgi:nucleoid DNA-binding protein
MTLNKQQLTRSIGRQTGIRSRDVVDVIDAMIRLVTDEIAAGGRIEIENFIVLEVKTISRKTVLLSYRTLKAKPGRLLRAALRNGLRRKPIRGD